MRSDVAFKSHGLTCRGWLYRPEGARGESPAIIISHGFSAVKEQGLHEFAQAFCDKGFVVLVFDYRFLGASDGAERGRIIPQEQHDDLRAALDWIAAQDFVDSSRIGMWGSSYSGGHTLFLAAVDPRVKAVVAQVPAIALARSLVHLSGKEGFDMLLGMLAADHAARNGGMPGGVIPVTAPVGQPCVLPGDDAHRWFAKDGGTWLNQTTLESVARMAEYLPAALIDLIAPRPVLIIAGESDALIPIEQVRDAFARAGEPKALKEYPCGHFDVYPGERFHAQAVADASEWFATHLKP